MSTESFGDEIDQFLNEVTAGRAEQREMGRHVLSPPSAGAFVTPDDQPIEFVAAPMLSHRAAHLLDEYTELAHIRGLEVRYLWRGAGGKSGGSRVLGKCQRLSGLARYLSIDEDIPADFVIWLAADHLRDYDERTIEAVLYHELCHIGWDDEHDKPVVLNHEFAGFLGELRRYGLYEIDLKNLGNVMRQLPLIGGDS